MSCECLTFWSKSLVRVFEHVNSLQIKWSPRKFINGNSCREITGDIPYTDQSSLPKFSCRWVFFFFFFSKLNYCHCNSWQCIPLLYSTTITKPGSLYLLFEAKLSYTDAFLCVLSSLYLFCLTLFVYPSLVSSNH